MILLTKNQDFCCWVPIITHPGQQLPCRQPCRRGEGWTSVFWADWWVEMEMAMIIKILTESSRITINMTSLSTLVTIPAHNTRQATCQQQWCQTASAAVNLTTNQGIATILSEVGMWIPHRNIRTLNIKIIMKRMSKTNPSCCWK